MVMNSSPIPDRESLLNELDRANRLAWLWIVTRLAVITALIFAIDWPTVVLTPIVSVTACLVITGPFLMSLMQIWGATETTIRRHQRNIEVWGTGQTQAAIVVHRRSSAVEYPNGPTAAWIRHQ